MISGWIDSDSPGRPEIKQQSCHQSRTTVGRRHPAWSSLGKELRVPGEFQTHAFQSIDPVCRVRNPLDSFAAKSAPLSRSF